MHTQPDHSLKSSGMSKKVLSLALPMGAIQFIMVASTFISMVMLSRLGHDVLAASALIYSTQTPIVVTGVSILFSLSILIGHAMGAKNVHGVGHYVQQGWVLGSLVSIPLILVFWNMDKLLIFFGQSKEMAELVKPFFHAYVWAVPALLWAVCNQQFCFGIQRQKLVAMQGIIGMAVLLISGYALIFGKLGFSPMGVKGYGYAMSLSVWFSFLFTLLCFLFRDEFKPYDLFNFRVHKDWSYLVKMAKIGGHISLQVGGEMLSLIALASMVGWLGADALAGYQVVTQYLFLVLIPIFAISQAVGILAGQICGEKQFSSLKHLGFESVRLILTISFMIALIFWLFPKSLASFYFDVNLPANAKTLNLSIMMFSVMAFSLVFSSIKNVLTGALRGLLDSRFPMMIGLGVIWLVGIPLSYFLAFVLNLGVIGVVMGSATAMLIDAIVLWFRWNKIVKAYNSKEREIGL